MGIKEIEKLNANEECLIGLQERLGELGNRIAISDEITNSKLMKEKKETNERKESLGEK